MPLAALDASPLPASAPSSSGESVTAVWRLVDGQEEAPTATPSLPPSPPDAARPSGRSFHTLTQITAAPHDGDDGSGPNEKFLLLFGGRGALDLAADTAWLYSSAHGRWAPLSVMSTGSSHRRPPSATACDAASTRCLLPLSEVAPRAYHTATPTLQGSIVWILGGKTALDGSADAVSSDLLRVQLVVRRRPPCTQGDLGTSHLHHRSSLEAFGVEAVVDQVLDASTSIGPRAYHGCVAVEDDRNLSPRPLFPAAAADSAATAASSAAMLVAFGGSSASLVIDAVSVFDTERLEWQHTFAEPETPHPRPMRAAVSEPTAPVAGANGATAHDVRSDASPDCPVSPEATPPRANRSCRRDAPESTVRDESGGRGGSEPARALSLEQRTAPASSSTLACAACGAPRGCVHTSRQLAGLVSCDGPQLLSASKLGASSRFTSSAPSAAAAADGAPLRTSLPPRDAAVVWATRARRTPAATPSATLHVLNGEVCTTFFDSAFTINVHPSADRADGSIRASWRADVVGRGGDDDGGGGTVPRHHVPIAYQCAWPLGGRCIAAWGGFSMDTEESSGATSSAEFHSGMQVFDTFAGRFRPCAAQLATGTERPPSKRASAAAATIPDVMSPDADAHHIGAAFVFGGDDGTSYFDTLWRCDVYDAPHGPAAARRTLRSMCEAFLDGRR